LTRLNELKAASIVGATFDFVNLLFAGARRSANLRRLWQIFRLCAIAALV
jgi:hypothetical protein